MRDRFSYFDFLVNIVPGFFIVWALNSISKNFLFGNVVTESLMFIILAYIVGLAIQFLSKYTIELMIKTFFWHNSFYSYIFLIKEYNIIHEFERKKYVEFAQKVLRFKLGDLKILETKDILKNNNKDILNEAKQISHSIYRSVDNYTFDKNLAKKAHIQNNHYCLSRNLAFSFLFVTFLFIILMLLSPVLRTIYYSMYILFSSLLFLIFTVRAKEKGELYIKGLFGSLI